jgi:hypothetical protein
MRYTLRGQSIVDTHAREAFPEFSDTLKEAVADIMDTPHIRVGGYLALCLIVGYPLLIRLCFLSNQF